MMGYIVRRNGRWQAAYRGPDRRERTRTFDRKVDAERWLATTEADLLRGEWVDPRSGQVLFEECANRWLASKVDLAPSSLDKVQRHVRRHILPVFGQRPVGHIQPADVRAWVAKMSAAGLAPDSVKAIYLTFGQIMSTAEIDRLVVRSPCVGIKLPKSTAREEQHFLSAEQVTLLAETITPRFRALIYTAAYAGLRAGEIGALRVDRLNLLAGTLEVAASVWEGKGQMVIGPPKSGKRRTLTIPRFLAEMLGEHIGTYRSANGYVFTSTEGEMLRHRNFYDRHFKPAVKAAGLPDELRFHDLRHTCAALLVADGRHMEEVKDYLGHSTIRVTSDRYGHLFPRAKQELAAGLDAIFTTASTAAAQAASGDVVAALAESKTRHPRRS
ncbi:MAG: site-specific integrase [Actinomycetota bacterium]|jgi:integrase